jgi:endo-1,4-beta-xylanase
VALLTPQRAIAQIVVSTNFEDGALDSWIPRGTGTTLTNSTNQANSGAHSLLTTGRTQTFGGPSIDLTKLLPPLSPGQTFVFTISVRMAEGQANDMLKMTMQSTISGANTFNTVAGPTNVTNGAWVKMVGAFTPSASATGLLLYIEGASATSSYYVDDFTVALSNGGCTNPPDNSGFFTDFEDGTTQGWTGRFGIGTVTNTTADAHTGSHSLLMTRRTATFQGPAHDITGKMCNGSQYWLEVWVKMAPGQPTTSINLSLQYTDFGGTLHFPGVTTATVTSGAWVRLKSKPYTFSGAYTNLVIYLQSTNNPTASFYIDDVKVQFLPPPVIENIPSIAQTYSSDFLVGYATLQQDLLGPHGQLAALHYNSVTPGNDLKWDTTEPSEGNFNFVPGDNIQNFAQAHNIKMRGHTFVWHNQVPAWVFQNNGVDMSTQPFSQSNKRLLLSRLQNHINTLINHYQDKIYVWDVVNEAIDESQPNGFRRSKWYMITVDPNNNPGYPEYMDDAFIYARQALDNLGIGRDKVKLCYNDFNTTIAAKRQFIYNWVKGAISRGVPIDCVGNQFHNTINFPIDDQGSAASKQSVIDTLNLFASLTSTAGVPIIDEITEFDISLYRFGVCSQTFYTDYDDLLAGDTADLINEGYRYRDYFQIFKNLHGKIDSVTLWGLGDDDSWLNPSSNKANCGVTAADAPLPFDSYLQHKYAYTGIVNPLALPGANLVTTIAASSGTILSGHAASYTITVANKGPNDAANLTLTDTVPANTTFQSMVAPGGWTCTVPPVGGSGQVSCAAASLANGASAQFTFTVNVVCATPNGTIIGDTAKVASTTLNPNPNPENSASVNITVSDPPPVFSALAPSLPVLWPPNHQMVSEFLSYSVTATCDPNPKLVLSVASNQSTLGAGSGHTTPDWVIIDPHDLQLRAERSPVASSGRVYTLTVTATDSAGASSNAFTMVTVPLSQGN